MQQQQQPEEEMWVQEMPPLRSSSLKRIREEEEDTVKHVEKRSGQSRVETEADIYRHHQRKAKEQLPKARSLTNSNSLPPAPLLV